MKQKNTVGKASIDQRNEYVVGELLRDKKNYRMVNEVWCLLCPQHDRFGGPLTLALEHASGALIAHLRDAHYPPAILDATVFEVVPRRGAEGPKGLVLHLRVRADARKAFDDAVRSSRGFLRPE